MVDLRLPRKVLYFISNIALPHTIHVITKLAIMVIGSLCELYTFSFPCLNDG